MITEPTCRTSRLLIALCFAIAIFGTTIARSEPLSWDRFSLPIGYAGNAELLFDGRPAQRLEFESARGWVKRVAFAILPGVGESLIDARVGSYTESWSLDARSSLATRTERFATELTDAGEFHYSPFGVIRPLIERKADATVEPMPSLGADGWRATAQLDGSVYEIDVVGRDVAQVRIMQAGQPRAHTSVAYSDWIDLGSSGRAPTTAVLTGDMPDGSGVMSIEYRLQIARVITEGTQVPELSVPDGYTVIDRIEGVSRRSDGTILGPIGTEASDAATDRGPLGPASHTSNSRSWQRATLIAGICMFVVAGVVLWHGKSRSD